MLIGTLALALFNASEDTIAQNFAYLYALISVGVLVASFFTLCSKHNPGAHMILCYLDLWMGHISKANYNDQKTGCRTLW